MAASGVSTLLFLAACGAPTPPGGAPAQADAPVPGETGCRCNPQRPDVAGDLQLTQGIIDEFVKTNPDMVSRVTYEKATAPDMAGKVKAQQDGRADRASTWC